MSIWIESSGFCIWKSWYMGYQAVYDRCCCFALAITIFYLQDPFAFVIALESPKASDCAEKVDTSLLMPWRASPGAVQPVQNAKYYYAECKHLLTLKLKAIMMLPLWAVCYQERLCNQHEYIQATQHAMAISVFMIYNQIPDEVENTSLLCCILSLYYMKMQC